MIPFSVLPLPISIAIAHLRARRRQSAVSILGVALGVGFFIAISGMMHGFQSYFLVQIVESTPHILITDEYRSPPAQPLEVLEPQAALDLKRVVARDPVRGIANAQAILDALQAMPGLEAAPALHGQGLLRRAGRDYGVTVLGIRPEREAKATQLAGEMVAGTLDALESATDGVILGSGLSAKLAVGLGDTVLLVGPTGGSARLRVVGLFKTGIETLDNGQAYIQLAKQQAIQGRPRVINEIRIRLAEVARSIPVAEALERRFGYKTAPWEETNSRVLSVFRLQNFIIYMTTGAILVVAGFGIFNIISTVVLEKARDIAILRSVGMPPSTVTRIFIVEGMVVGAVGMLIGWLVGFAMAEGLRMIPAPGATDTTQTLRVDTSLVSFAIAGGIAMATATLAAWLPASRAARVDPLAIIRGAA
ncbi:ABC transporter permease [Azospirillum sp. sgz302134]